MFLSGRRGIALVCALWLLAGVAHAQAALRIGTWDHGENNPSVLSSEAVLTAAYAEIKQPIVFVNLPVRRALIALLSGDVDANLHRSLVVAQDQPALYRVETPINVVKVHGYTLRLDITLKQWGQLSGMRVAHQRGILALEKNLPSDAKPVLANSREDAFRLLAAGAADIALVTEDSQSPISPWAIAIGAARLPGSLDEIVYYHYLLSRHRAVGMRLNEVLKRMQSSGEMQAIRLKAIKNIKG